MASRDPDCEAVRDQGGCEVLGARLGGRGREEGPTGQDGLCCRVYLWGVVGGLARADVSLGLVQGKIVEFLLPRSRHPLSIDRHYIGHDVHHVLGQGHHLQRRRRGIAARLHPLISK